MYPLEYSKDNPTDFIAQVLLQKLLDKNQGADNAADAAFTRTQTADVNGDHAVCVLLHIFEINAASISWPAPGIS